MAGRKRGASKKRYTIGDRFKMFMTFCFRLGTLGIITVLVLLYGPWDNFRDWLISTAMTTMTHQYLATWFYDENMIAYSQNKNKIIETGEKTDTSEIDTSGKIYTMTGQYDNEYERQVLERDPKNNDYKIIPINESSYNGYLAVVYDPSRVKALVTNKIGETGEYLTKMAKDYNALIAINGGGFIDPNFESTGGEPCGMTIIGGKFVTTHSWDGSGGLIGFDKDNKLVLGHYTVTEAKEAGIRDAVTFGPYLIVNGQSSKVLGNGGWGTAQRTAIGQRKDGIVLFLVLDGRKVNKPGADMDDLIKIMERYGAYNAANLDGGTSSALVVGDTIVNDPIDSAGAHKTRPIATGFYVTKDNKDDSDHSAVQKKLDK